MHPTRPLAETPLFRQYTHDWPLDARLKRSYERSKAIGKTYAFSAHDIITLSPKYWQLHTDPICGIDGAAAILTMIQLNLCAGTIAPHAPYNPAAAEALRRVLAFEVFGQFCLTEVAHGIDAMHLETTAELMPDGTFDLNSPHEGAGKFMPPTIPLGDPCIAVVMARAMADGIDYGIMPFLVPINDGNEMHPGVVCRYLTQRGGTTPLSHAITYFDHVTLPRSAMLGKLGRSIDHRQSFFNSIWRVTCGTISMSSLGIPALQIISCIAARYSMRRTVYDNVGVERPIISFRTQSTPILVALAQSFAMKALLDKVIPQFTDTSLDPRVRHALATITKAVMVRHTQAAALEISERCGAQGQFEINQIAALFIDFRGIAIAEGDLLALCIRLATELLLRRYSIPQTINPDSLLSQHESGLFSELEGALQAIKNHRGEEFNTQVLPRCQNLIQAIGHRMAYDAAVSLNLDDCLVDTYVSSCISLDAAWYVEKAGLSRGQQRDMENRAIDAMFPRLDEFLARSGVEPYISAPIISASRWTEHISQLAVYGNSSRFTQPHSRL